MCMNNKIMEHKVRSPIENLYTTRVKNSLIPFLLSPFYRIKDSPIEYSFEGICNQNLPVFIFNSFDWSIWREKKSIEHCFFNLYLLLVWRILSIEHCFFVFVLGNTESNTRSKEFATQICPFPFFIVSTGPFGEKKIHRTLLF